MTTNEKIMCWFTAVIALAAIVAATVAGLQWCTLKNQLQETIRESKAIQRPFLTLTKDPEISVLKFDKSGFPSADVRLTVHNAGMVPARAVVFNMDFRLMPPPYSPDRWHEYVRPNGIDRGIDGECDYNTMGKISDSENGGEFIVPGFDRSFLRPVRGRQGDRGNNGKTQVFLVGCIAYYDPVEWKPKSHPNYRFSFVETFIQNEGGWQQIDTSMPDIKGCFAFGHWGDNKWGELEDTGPQSGTPEQSLPTQPNCPK